ncbi:SnoaL-like protein [Diaminobutyricimonas aerilata]|uniref:SnoaL-like protein n=1 Tax=Diaminobutyricimonas aerilata TaxID=1162967 RepID=A0A2M9CHL1_9MICO|nr:nuclear transport factor 2 family protein [Diaminobutyricimonas aerilata]PJJ71345.1 SnoaL-like protein [Diaminobutyricimonas aerilata]
MTVNVLPEAVDKFVTTTNAHDADALFAVFAPGASVVDDGTTYATEAEVREWIKVHQIDPKIVITPTSFEGDRLVASVDGDFPGGPLQFAFTFTTRDDAITALSIELA